MSSQKENQIKLLVPYLPKAEHIIGYLDEIDENNIYSNRGPLDRRFCGDLEKFFCNNCKTLSNIYVSTVTNGTTAIELALKAKAKYENKYVLIPSYTFVATAHAVRNAGFEPFFIDIEQDTLAISPGKIYEALKYVPHPAAIIVVSPFGAPINIREWENFESKTNIPIIYDAAAAALSINYVGYQPICISMHATKTMGSGETGLVLSSDKNLISSIISTANFGFEENSRLSVRSGGNYRISEYTAAVGLASLKDIARKKSVLFQKAHLYQDNLINSGINLQNGFGVSWIAATMNVIMPNHIVNERLNALDNNKVPWRRWYGEGCHLHPAFSDCKSSNLETTFSAAFTTIGVPFHEFLSEDEINFVCSILRNGK